MNELTAHRAPPERVLHAGSQGALRTIGAGDAAPGGTRRRLPPGGGTSASMRLAGPARVPIDMGCVTSSLVELTTRATAVMGSCANVIYAQYTQASADSQRRGEARWMAAQRNRYGALRIRGTSRLAILGLYGKHLKACVQL